MVQVLSIEEEQTIHYNGENKKQTMTTTKIHRKLKFKQHETNTNMGMKLYFCSSL
jgi:hypothetical protein